jgi:peroxiredoxin
MLLLYFYRKISSPGCCRRRLSINRVYLVSRYMDNRVVNAFIESLPGFILRPRES